MYINLSTLIPVGVGVKVPAGSLLNVRDLGISLGHYKCLAEYRTVLVVWSTTLPVYGLALHMIGVVYTVLPVYVLYRYRFAQGTVVPDSG
jgi:hypothetical protein